MAEQAKAIFYEAFGDLTNMKTGSRSLPEVDEGGVLVNIKAAGVNSGLPERAVRSFAKPSFLAGWCWPSPTYSLLLSCYGHRL